MGVASFDSHTTLDCRALVALCLSQQFSASTLRPHLDLGSVLKAKQEFLLWSR